MRLERLTYNKIKFFITADDLLDRGLSKEDLGSDSLKWNQLFLDMIKEANEEYGVEIQGTIDVEVFTLQSQGMIMIVTVEEKDDEDSLHDFFLDMQVTIEGNEEIIYEFDSFEEVIHLSNRFMRMNVFGGDLYVMSDRYYLVFDRIKNEDKNKLISILAEYGSTSLISIHRLIEYGKQLIHNTTVETVSGYFNA